MYKHIMVPLDGSELAECVLPHLKAMAGEGYSGKITLASVVESLHIHGGLESGLNSEERHRLDESNADKCGAYIDGIAKRLSIAGGVVECKVLHGHVAEELANYANKHEVDLIIISTHGRSGVSRWVFGSVADRVLRSSCVPVLMVRAPGCIPGA